MKKVKKETKQVVIHQMPTLPDHKKVEAMAKYYRENPPTLGLQAPTTSKLKNFKVDDLINTLLPQYQRGYEHSRTERIVHSMIRFDKLGSSIVTVVMNQKGEIVAMHDGRHRLVALHILNEKIVKANIVQFKEEADEIDYFNMINESQRPLTPEQRILNCFQAEDPLAILIYDLGYIDTDSKWHNKVSLLGTTDSPKGKLSVANFRKIVNWAGLGLRRRMEGESDIRALRKLEKMDYSVILNGMNSFHDYYYQFARFPHYVGDVFTKDKVIISLLEFFYCAIRQNSHKAVLSPQRILRSSVSKFRLFNFKQLQDYDAGKAPNSLFEEFNGKGPKARANPVVRLGIES